MNQHGKFDPKVQPVRSLRPWITIQLTFSLSHIINMSTVPSRNVCSSDEHERGDVIVFYRSFTDLFPPKVSAYLCV